MSASPQSAAPAREEITLMELLGVLRRRSLWPVLGLVLGAAGAAGALYLGALRHEARATLIFPGEGPGTELLAGLDLPLGLGAFGASQAVGGEVEALRARPLLAGILRARGPLAPPGRCVQVDDLARQSAWRSLWGAPAELAGLAVEVQEWPFPDDEPEGLVLLFGPEGSVEARREGWLGAREPARPFRPGEPVTLLGARLVVRAEAAVAGRRLRVRCPPLGRAVDELLERLRVAEEPSGSSVVRVRLQDADGRRAVELTNGLVQAYLEENRARRGRLAARSTDFLAGELARVHGELAAAEGRLEALGQLHGPLALPGTATEVVAKLTDVDLERARLALELGAAEETLARLRAGELSSDAIAALEVTGLFEHDLVEPLLGLVARRDELAREFTPEHPDVARADAAIAQRIAAIESVIESERWKRAEGTRELEELVQGYQAELEKLPAIQLELARERRAVDAFTQIYLYLLGRIEEAHIQQASAVPAADVLEWAEPPYEPAGPDARLHLAVGLVLGLGAGVAAAFLREYQERPVVGARRAESLLGIECVPLARRGPAASAALATLRALLPRRAQGGRPLLVVAVGRRARADELALELARHCAQSGERVLLVDADLAGGRLHERLERPATPGLGELLASGVEDERAQQATGQARLTLVARGSAAGAPDAGRLGERLATWSRAHERVLVAAPRLAGAATAYELAGPEVDCLLCLAEAGEEELARVVRRLAQRGARPVAGVLQA